MRSTKRSISAAELTDAPTSTAVDTAIAGHARARIFEFYHRRTQRGRRASRQVLSQSSTPGARSPAGPRRFRRSRRVADEPEAIHGIHGVTSYSTEYAV